VVEVVAELEERADVLVEYVGFVFLLESVTVLRDQSEHRACVVVVDEVAAFELDVQLFCQFLRLPLPGYKGLSGFRPLQGAPDGINVEVC
jgi:hypothetical protein